MPPATERDRKMRSGTSGAFETFACSTRKAARRMTPKRQRHEDLGRAPRVGLGAHEGEHQGDQASGHRDGAAQVEVAVHHVGP